MIKILIITSSLVAICLSDGYNHHMDDWSSGGKYKFEYGVKDPHTGDHKSQWEISDGHGGLKGGYTLDEADGTKRYVQYKSDKWNGFQAIVKRIGHAVHPKSYGAPFVARHEEDHDDHSSGGNNGWKQYNQQQYQKGWDDQLATYSNHNNNNGWTKGDDMIATSYVKQKNFY